MNNLPGKATGTAPVYLLHGVFAVQDAVRGYSLVEVQQGVITALDATSITVTSPDGYARTYLLGDQAPSRLATVAPGSRVTVMMTSDGSLHLAEVGEPPIDGSRLSALVPVMRLAG